MSQRHFIAASIGTRPHIALICLFLFIAGAQNVHPQSQIARDVFAIFEGSCLICHGPDGAYRETLLMEHSELIDGGTVVPGNPNASELYKRLLGNTERGVQMPFNQPQLPAQSIDTIRRWILAGAPDWAAAPITTRRFIPPSEVLKAIDSHVKTISPFDRPYARYFTMTHLYNAGVAADILEEYLKALAKLVNSLSWGLDIVNPTPIDREETIFYIDLRHYEWDRNDGWTKIEEAYPYYVGFNAPAQRSLKNQLSQLQTTLTTAVPSVNIDWFIATAAAAPLYNALLSLPGTDRELETRLEVDVVNNILTAPGIRVWRAGFNNSGVSNHNRVVERHASRYGAYWKSYDFAGSVGKQNIFTHPLAFTHNGGEVIFNLPNGLQGYYLVDGDGFRLDEAPISIVSNPAASDPTVRNGLSCIGCHTEGMKEVTDQVRSVIESDTNPAYNKAHALQLYVADSTMDSKVNEDLVRYQRALTATGNTAGDVEPVSRFHEAFHSTLDLSQAAAAVGLEPAVFLSKIRENTGLQTAGLLVLDGGQIKRDTWASSFRDVIHALDYPQKDGEPPVVTQPDVIPGSNVPIPDFTLRTIIAEALGKNVDDPITVNEMKELTSLESNNRRVQDLTGLQFATNLFHLELDNSRVPDLSPLRGLTNLIFLEVHGSFSDLSPISGLINLHFFDFAGPNVSDLSPLKGLPKLQNSRDFEVTLPKAVIQNGFVHIPDINLRSLIEEVLGTKTIKPTAMATLTTLKARNRGILNLSGLEYAINLEELWISNNPVYGLSPLSSCTNLIRLFAWETPNISDVSPLANLTKLEQLEFKDSKIRDISSLVHLKNLRVLQFYAVGISDISPLSGMTKLERVRFRHSDVMNISPLANAVNLEWIDLASSEVSDLSPLRHLTKLEFADLTWNRISNIEPLRHLTNLTRLELKGNQRISDVSALAGLVNLERLELSFNKVSDVSTLAGLTKLRTLELEHNEITDFSPLAGLPVYHKMHWHNNPGFFAKAPKIEGPWLWVFLPNAKLDNNADLLSKSSGGMIAEVAVSTNGAIKGQPVGDDVWTSHKLPSAGQNNLGDMLGRSIPNGVIFGSIALDSPKEQHINMYAGSRDWLKVWLNGVLIYERLERPWLANDYIAPTSFFSATLQRGRNVLLVAASTRSDDYSNVFFGFDPDTSYFLETVIDYVFTQTSIHVNDTFSIDIQVGHVTNLAGWQFDIVFDSNLLEAINVSEGDFLKTDGGATFFQSGRIDNAAGKITGLIAGRISEGGVSGTGSLLQVRLKAKSEGETELALQNFLFGSDTEESIPAGPLEIRITVEKRLLTGDVNRDGVVNILDLIRVARQLGQRVSADSAVDINGDGVVNIFDLTLVAQGIGKTSAAAPTVATGSVDPATIEVWIAQARLADDGSIAFRQGIANLENLLASLIIPQETALLANYPNPFNPETWIPYQLAVPAEVTLTIYDMNGGSVRRLEVGHQAAGMYQSRNRAAFWDGRNGRGESVASGLYFYTLRAGDFTATRRLLIRK